MKKLKFSGEVDLDYVFDNYKLEIFTNLLDSIKENYHNSEIKEINVVKIIINSKEYSVNQTRDKFIIDLERCITFFEGIEAYEKCQECVNIIKELKEMEGIAQSTLKKKS